MKGNYPIPYFMNPNVNKPIEEIWDDIDAYSGEFFEDETAYHEKIDVMIPLPPLKYKGIFTKGILLTQGAEYLLKLFPEIKELFYVGAYTMWSSYSWCDKADLYFACYENKARENYHKNKYQKKKDIIFLPLQDADFTNEYMMAPAFNTPKEVDIISVSTPYQVKNHIVIAQAIKAYEKKYHKKLKARFIFGLSDITKDKKGNIDYSKLSEISRGIIDKVNETLDGDMKKYVDVIPRVNHWELNKYYTSARCLVLASLIEGKNRSINEAMSCNTPVVAFKQHNQWARGDFPIFFGNSGELAEEFSPESLADAIHKILSHPENYEPRKNYLIHNGRKNFLNTCMKYIPAYRETIPDLKDNKITDSIWADLACQDLYQLSLHDFLYSNERKINWVQGVTSIRFLFNYYYYLFGIKPKNKGKSDEKNRK